MEEVLGMGVEAWNAYFADFQKREELLVANSVWINSGAPVEIREDFLKMNAGVYSAGIYEIPFDEEAVKEINGWVKAHTDGMIEEILDQISEDTMLYLINAVSFEARWSKQYDKDQVSDGVFTREDGETRTVSMMSSKESFFLEDENAVGFMKYYENANYAFVALLPDEGLSVADYLESLTGERITALLGNLQSASVTAAMPMFEYSYDAELKEVLAAMGMTDAFDPEQADYTGIGTFSEGDDNLFLAEVLHKTSIAVDRNGTRASAVTKIAMDGAISPEEEQREVTLDRPFVYMIVDSALKVPVFIGTVMDPSET